MATGEVELGPEVDAWFDRLDQDDRETAAFYVDLLAEHGALLSGPLTRQLRGALREIRFHLEWQAVRISYWVAPDKRIVLLTVLRKHRLREEAGVQRAWRAMRRCIAQPRQDGEPNRG